ncbi:MAG TPA: SigE family RNA polymerase sigma factor [Nocardioidaceae bacterium]|nr:SigE family RNA polymerase sigma factor [Nocardioidaceae bacterium]
MSRRSKSDEEYVIYVASRRRHLLATAYLLAGDWHRAEDLVQTTLTKLYQAWPRVQRKGDEDAYVRTILVRVGIDARRRLWNRERTVDEMPEVPAVDRGGYEQRDELVRALATLPPRQRATVVLRYWLDLSVEDTASELGVSAGTVKSQTAKALEHLRTHLALDETTRG